VNTPKDLARRVLPEAVWKRLRQMWQRLVAFEQRRLTAACRKFGARNPVEFQRALEDAGYQVARSADYYSPLLSVSQLKANSQRWNRPSSLLGVQYDLNEMKALLGQLLTQYLDEFMTLPSYLEITNKGFGPGYTAVDALTLYAMIRHLKPRRYIEVGSGISTYYCSLAAQRNEAEGTPLQITCIEPYPYEKLSTIPGVHVLAKKVEDVDRSEFQQLDANDVLFVDSSHILRIDGDVAFLFLEVIPSLNAGVITHVHDIPFPYNFPYPPDLWIFGRHWPMFWNEAMVLQAFLAFNRNFDIILSTPLIRYFDEPFLQQRIPIYETIEQNPNTFSSIWLKRVS